MHGTRNHRDRRLRQSYGGNQENNRPRPHGGRSAAQPSPDGNRGEPNDIDSTGRKGGSDPAICKGGPNIICNKPVRERDDGLSCDSCKFWFHTECRNVSPSDYDMIQSFPPDLLSWFCHDCKPSVTKLLNAVANVTKRCDILEE